MTLLLRLLLAIYYPFIAGVCLLMAGILVWLVTLVPRLSVLAFVLLPVAGLLALTIWQLVSSASIIFGNLAGDDPFEMGRKGVRLGFSSQPSLTSLAALVRARRIPDPRPLPL